MTQQRPCAHRVHGFSRRLPPPSTRDIRSALVRDRWFESGSLQRGVVCELISGRASMGLYDPAFATLTGLYGRAARGPITGITLIAGFASTVGWPLSALLEADFGWRGACLVW